MKADKVKADKVKAFGYLRTSSATNVGEDKDSDKRQMAAITGYAERIGIDVVEWFYDASVKGSDPITSRPGFAAMLEAIAGNGVRTILVETPNRFARDLVVQETGFSYLKGLGVSLVPVDAPEYFTGDDDPMRKAIRQILGVIAELDKSMTVAKLRAARDRKSAAAGRRIEGRKPAPEEARKLAVALKRDGLSLREIAGQLAKEGYHGPSGKPYGPGSIVVMVSGLNEADAPE